MKKENISDAVIRRLPRYYRQLTDLCNRGVVRISSHSLGQEMNITASQIRQDFSCFGEFGQQGYGYNVSTLREEIATILGTDRGYSVVIVGVGNLGHALIENFGFSSKGYKVLGAFDVDPKIVGTDIADVHVYHSDELFDILEKTPADIAVLSVPRRIADDMASRLCDAGIKAIWNFTNIELAVKDRDVLVENIHFADSMLVLTYHLAEQDDLKK